MADELMPVADALAQVLAAAKPLGVETSALHEAAFRTLASDVAATRTQPPFPASAMDGYAVRASDCSVGARLKKIGEAAAGRAFNGTIGAHETIRIFTGAPVPDGADAILIQENATVEGDTIVARETLTAGRFVRPRGLDFAEGDFLLKAGSVLNARALGLAAAMGLPVLPVRKKPVVSVLATGDELVRPGERVGPDQIVASNSYAVCAMASAKGARAIDLGIARDTMADLDAALDRAEAEGTDVLVTLGGASVGDHDLVQKALTNRGMKLGFWKIAMRPGKPLIFGALGNTIVLGLPGNPVSSIVCTKLFLEPLIAALLGQPDPGGDPSEAAILGADMPENDLRQDYVRSRLSADPSGLPRVVPFGKQDSSMLRLLTESDALLIRAPFAPAAKAGETVRIIRL
jgi:molybdopterin molybdotransferase